jgi:hypothetical protein
MNTRNPHSSGWNTTTLGGAPVTLEPESSALGEHLRACKQMSGRLFGWRCHAAAAHGFMAAHFITSVLVLAVLVLIVVY